MTGPDERALAPLQKWLQRAGWGTKMAVRLAIRDGRVRMEGEVVTRFAEPVPPGAVVTVDDEVVGTEGPRVVLLMNKPPKHLTLLDGQRGLPGLRTYLPKDLPPTFPVGRLDVNTEGALLFTNDGQLARRVLHPDWSLEKVYHVKLRGHLEPDDPRLAAFVAGVRFDGQTYSAVRTAWVAKRTRSTWVEIVLNEGRHRQIRFMCRALRFQIVKLRRMAIGPILLGDLNKRCVRPLSEAEVGALDAAVGLR